MCLSTLYIILFLHQTTTNRRILCIDILLYIILFLHQTTTHILRVTEVTTCISSFFYIKPQRLVLLAAVLQLVYHPFSTSNHNTTMHNEKDDGLVYHPFSTSNHNLRSAPPSRSSLVYHPFSTSNHNERYDNMLKARLVYHPFSTSNHNTTF